MTGTAPQFIIAGIAALVAVSCLLGWFRFGGKFLDLSDPQRSDRSGKVLLTAAGLCGAIFVWSAFSFLRPSGVTRIPSLPAVATALNEMVASGTLTGNLLTSCWRIVVGFGFACLAGIGIGWISGTFFLANRLILPASSFLRYIPPTAFVTLLIVYFGIDENYKYAVVFVSVFFFIIQMTVDAVEDVDRRYFEMALLSGLPRSSILLHIVIPATLPRVVDLIRINLSGAWTFLVAAEVVGADGGLGHLIAISQRFGRIEELYVTICVFGIIGVTSDWLLRIFRLWVFRWQP